MIALDKRPWRDPVPIINPREPAPHEGQDFDWSLLPTERHRRLEPKRILCGHGFFNGDCPCCSVGGGGPNEGCEGAEGEICAGGTSARAGNVQVTISITSGTYPCSIFGSSDCTDYSGTYILVADTACQWVQNNINGICDNLDDGIGFKFVGTAAIAYSTGGNVFIGDNFSPLDCNDFSLSLTTSTVICTGTATAQDYP
ncbi:MAG: hypothetical protein KDA99_30885 [Planctomycetales bacterium]|nr:hypothetical protein [Planctomycetales bacterium]